jgi:PadR family transcriptional regulator PadR
MKMPRRSNSSPQARTLFTALLQQPQTWRHGYDLSKDTGLKSGTLYPLLMRLSDLGLLESRWEDPEKPGRPPRHAYRLTATGLVFARDTTLASAAPAPTVRTGEVPA